MRIALCFFLLIVPSRLFGQSAELSGYVKDPTGAVVPNATVELRNQDTGVRQQAITNGDGIYRFLGIKAGVYQATVHAQGFTTLTRDAIVLNAAERASMDFSLQVGGTEQAVNVTAEVPLVNATDGSVSTVVDRRFVENMPLNGRSFQSLIGLSPGAVVAKTDFSNQGQFSVNGQRSDANYFTVDGVSANVGMTGGGSFVQAGGGSLPGLTAAGGTNGLVSVDAMQEFRIQTSTYAPEFGRQPGAQVQIVTRSGTNDFHGAIFDYFRNDALDANDWFANANRQPRPLERQNDFGGVFGGPVLLPRFGKGGQQPWYNGRNRTFFFLSYEGLRLRQPQTNVILVPSLASRRNALARVQPFLNAFSVPNGPETSNGYAQFAASYSNPATLNATSIRIDDAISQKLTLFGRFNYATSSTVQRINSLNETSTTPSHILTLTIGSTQILRSSVSNEVRANYSKTRSGLTLGLDSFGGAVPPSDSLLFPALASREDGVFRFNLDQVKFELGKQNDNLQRQFNLVDNLSIVSGTHQLKFGSDYRLARPTLGVSKYVQNDIFTNLAQALAGIVRTAGITAQNPINLSFTNISFFAEDTWRPHRRLTLTYGLRWDIDPPPKGIRGTEFRTVSGLDSPATMTLAPAGTPLYKTTYGNVAPRIGFAYQLLQGVGREAILRGGFGIFNDSNTGRIADVSGGAPNSSLKNLSNITFPLDPAAAAPAPFTLDPPFFKNGVPDHNLKEPRVYQWNFAVEKSVGTAETVSASYVAAMGRRLLRTSTLFSPNPNFSFVGLIRNTATSDYHALQLQFQRRLSRGLQALASYTWSHSIDIISSGVNSDSITDLSKPNVDRASSNFDARHALSAAATYSIPTRDLGPLAGKVLRDWSVDAIFTARSATPVNLIARTITFPVQTSIRPDLVLGVPLYVDDPLVPGGRRFNPAAFTIPLVDRQGTLDRNVLRGFPVWQLDVALRRLFHVTERVGLQFTVEAFNLFNHPNFGDPTATLTSGLFGRSTSMLGRSLGSGGVNGGFNPLYQIGGPRSIQLSLRLQF